MAETLRWEKTPTGRDFAEAFPERAMQRDVEGRATIVCQIGPELSLTECVTESETPDAYGFGHAATTLGPLFKLGREQGDAGASPGATVRVKLRFNLPRHGH